MESSRKDIIKLIEEADQYVSKNLEFNLEFPKFNGNKKETIENLKNFRRELFDYFGERKKICNEYLGAIGGISRETKEYVSNMINFDSYLPWYHIIQGSLISIDASEEEINEIKEDFLGLWILYRKLKCF